MKDQSTEEIQSSPDSTPAVNRRKALARLGLAAGVAYAAPTIVRLDRSANSKVLPTPCPRPVRRRGARARVDPGANRRERDLLRLSRRERPGA
jgi:hypothetical protein